MKNTSLPKDSHMTYKSRQIEITGPYELVAKLVDRTYLYLILVRLSPIVSAAFVFWCRR